ncbi:hypothetical protein ABT086_00240 [Streptomyces mirabilis]
MPLLPPIGAEIPCSMLAVNTPLQIRTSLLSLDFRGGIKHRVEVNPDDPDNSVRMRVVGFKLTADLPQGDGAGGRGAITIEQNDVDVDPKSLLRVVQQNPPKIESLMALYGFTMVIDQDGEPLVLTPRDDTGQLIATLPHYPPKADQYQLRRPIELVLPDDPETTIATIQKLPLKVGGL